MAKYYATCGSQSLIVSAPSAQFAAMRLIDEVLAAHIWIYEDAELSERDRRDHLALEALLHLSNTVKLSERGLGRDEAGTIGVPELIEHWHRLMTRLSHMLSSSGLADRRVLPKPPRLQRPKDLPPLT